MAAAGAPERPQRVSWGVQVLYVVYCFFCLIVLSSYTANLTSFLAVQRADDGITGLQDVIQSSGAVVVNANSSTLDYFLNSRDSLAMQLRPALHTCAAVEQCVAAVRQGRVAGYVGDYSVLTYQAMQQPCDVAVVGDTFGAGNLVIGLQKDSPLTPLFNAALQSFSEDGTLTDLYRTWFTDRSQCADANSRRTDSRLTIRQMLGAFVFLGLGVVAAVATETLRSLKWCRLANACRRCSCHCCRGTSTATSDSLWHGRSTNDQYDSELGPPSRIHLQGRFSRFPLDLFGSVSKHSRSGGDGDGDAVAGVGPSACSYCSGGGGGGGGGGARSGLAGGGGSSVGIGRQYSVAAAAAGGTDTVTGGVQLAVCVNSGGLFNIAGGAPSADTAVAAAANVTAAAVTMSTHCRGDIFGCGGAGGDVTAAGAPSRISGGGGCGDAAAARATAQPALRDRVAILPLYDGSYNTQPVSDQVAAAGGQHDGSSGGGGGAAAFWRSGKQAIPAGSPDRAVSAELRGAATAAAAAATASPPSSPLSDGATAATLPLPPPPPPPASVSTSPRAAALPPPPPPFDESVPHTPPPSEAPTGDVTGPTVPQLASTVSQPLRPSQPSQPPLEMTPPAPPAAAAAAAVATRTTAAAAAAAPGTPEPKRESGGGCSGGGDGPSGLRHRREVAGCSPRGMGDTALPHVHPYAAGAEVPMTEAAPATEAPRCSSGAAPPAALAAAAAPQQQTHDVAAAPAPAGPSGGPSAASVAAPGSPPPAAGGGERAGGCGGAARSAECQIPGPVVERRQADVSAGAAAAASGLGGGGGDGVGGGAGSLRAPVLKP
ncbi:hypothetical protein PLESTB_000212100 [Pleodorina starrii]|uniref:Ionotropic glutamate receptor C-terminal domain-containing protein n=1 Tax=Pleodorina starrii TaxID=330485 RepID=A0A9W6BC67_9CHLO|nr:hypothetical protein PLESTB_000212100 [Pleodorina starrii]